MQVDQQVKVGLSHMFKASPIICKNKPNFAVNIKTPHVGQTHLGQIPQDGKNEQYVALFFNFWRFTVTKRLDFFKFSQLFWRDYVR